MSLDNILISIEQIRSSRVEFLEIARVPQRMRGKVKNRI